MLTHGLVIGTLLLLSVLSFRLEALTAGGAALMFLMGTGIELAAGWRGLLLIFLFFATSSAASRWKKEEKAVLASILDKTDRRDWLQVLANGGPPLLFCIGYGSAGHLAFLYAYIAAVAAANADTWASEWGVLSKGTPRLLLSFRPVPKGTSGGATLAGTMAGLGGAALIGLSAFLLWYPVLSPQGAALAALLGFSGMLLDSLFGEVVQEKNRCRICGEETERKDHCGEKTVRVRGIPHFTNDVVNLLSVSAAGLLALLVKMLPG